MKERATERPSTLVRFHFHAPLIIARTRQGERHALQFRISLHWQLIFNQFQTPSPFKNLSGTTDPPSIPPENHVTPQILRFPPALPPADFPPPPPPRPSRLVPYLVIYLLFIISYN